MDVGLPRETQQIDRVMEAFADRYRQCHPTLFSSEGSRALLYHSTVLNLFLDHPYILAFSLIMLHTDAFNKSNKRKMTKADYIKNTRLPGVPPEVLDVSLPCFLRSFADSVDYSASTITSASSLLFISKIHWTLQDNVV